MNPLYVVVFEHGPHCLVLDATRILERAAEWLDPAGSLATRWLDHPTRQAGMERAEIRVHSLGPAVMVRH